MKLSKEIKKLANDLNLSEVDAYLMQFKSRLYMKCADLIKSSHLSHEQIAKKIGTSRSRICRISSHGENNVSIELLLKIILVLEGMPVFKFAA